jgi:hypothetical protein
MDKKYLYSNSINQKIINFFAVINKNTYVFKLFFLILLIDKILRVVYEYFLVLILFLLHIDLPILLIVVFRKYLVLDNIL